MNNRERREKKNNFSFFFFFFFFFFFWSLNAPLFRTIEKKKMVIKRNQETVAVDFRLSRSLAQVLSSLVGKIKKKRKKVTRRG